MWALPGQPRHVEAQILADQHGHVVVAVTRDCSLQRRHQKLVEEAPAPFLSTAQRHEIYTSAKVICRVAGYHGAGTVEYLAGTDGTVSFLEVNTRLQVEHPVTEETTGLDLAREQFRIPAVEPLSVREDPVPHGRGFLPAPGVVARYASSPGTGVRVDSGIEQGTIVGAAFDSMLAKLIVHADSRDAALARARRALGEMVVGGLPTVLPFHRAVVNDPGLRDRTAADAIRDHRYMQPAGAATAGDIVTAPMQGTVVKVPVAEGELVDAGAVIAVVEAMKMENAVRAHRAGTMTRLAVTEGTSDHTGFAAVPDRVIDAWPAQ